MENQSLATELLHLLKQQSKKWFIAFIVVLSMLFVSNLAWLYAWCLPTDDYYVEVDSEGGSNAILNESGEVMIDGESGEESN